MNLKLNLKIVFLLLLSLAVANCGRIWGTVVYNSGSGVFSFKGPNSMGTNACRSFNVLSATAVTSNTQVALSGNGSGTFFSDIGCTISTSVITIAAGQSSAAFYFKDSTVENLVFRGVPIGSSQITSSLSIVNGTPGWSNRTPGTTPIGLWAPRLAYDSKRKTTILYGGSSLLTGADTDYQAEMWEWDGNAGTWTQICDPCAPGARARHGLVYDSVRDKIVLFGGQDTTATFHNDVWEWDGTSWTNKTAGIVGGPPTAREDFWSVFDSNRNRMVVFGGNDGGNKNDVWEYDGSNWFGPFTPGGLPTARADSGAPAGAFDPIHNKMIVYGGDEPAYTDQAYSWDGTSWALLCNACTGTPRHGAYAAFDTSRNRFVIMQGEHAGSELTGIWEFNGTTFANTLANGPGDPAPAADSGGSTYDPDRAKMIYFDGNCCGIGSNVNVTFEYGSP